MGWKCELYDKAWGPKEYIIRKGDLCSKGLSGPIRPTCNEKIFPTIRFFHPKIKDGSCVVKMKLGANDTQNVGCIEKVAESIEGIPVNERKLIYTTHGHF